MQILQGKSMLLLTISFSRAESPWPDAVASSYGHMHDQSSIFKSVDITLIPAYIPTHLNVGADYLSWDWMLPEWYLLPQVAQAAFHLWGLPEVDLLASSCTTQCQHYYPLESLLLLWALGLNAFNILGCFR